MSTLIVTVYSHQLNEPWKSFDSNLKLTDFKNNLQNALNEAKKVVYVNPKNESLVLKDKLTKQKEV